MLPFLSLDSAYNIHYDYERNYDDGGMGNANDQGCMASFEEPWPDVDGIKLAPYKVTQFPLEGAEGQNVSCEDDPKLLPNSPFHWLACTPAVLRFCYLLLAIFAAIYGILFPPGASHLCLTTEDYVCVTTAQYYNAHSLYEGDSNYRVSNALPPGVVVLDGASTCNIVTDASQCSNIRNADITVRVGGSSLNCSQIGDVYYDQQTLGGDIRGAIVKDVRIIPNFGINVLSENTFLNKGSTVVKEPDPITRRIYARVVSGDGVLQLRCERHNCGLFLLYGKNACRYGSAACATNATLCTHHLPDLRHGDYGFLTRENSEENDLLLLWHRRFGHRNFRDVANYLRGLGVNFKMPTRPPFCATCVEAKSSRYPLRRNQLPRLRAPRPGYLLHSDNCGPFKIPTRGGGHVWFNVIVDDYSGRIWVKLLNLQSEFGDHLREVIAQLESEMGHDKVVAQLHSDAATYFEKDKTIQDFCRVKGIRQTFSPPGTPALNSVAERTIRTLCEMARANMIHAAAPESLWGESIIYAAYILNNLPYKQGSNATRNSLFYSQPPPTELPSRLVPFGCAAWAMVKGDGKSVSAPKAKKCIVAGWDERRLSWRLITVQDYSRLKFSGHVTMNMDEFPCRKNKREKDSSEIYDFVTDNDQCRAPVTPDPDDLPVTIAASRGRRAVAPSAQALRNIAGGNSAHFAHGELTTSSDDWSYATTCYSDCDLPQDAEDITFAMIDDMAYAILMKTEPPDWSAAMATDTTTKAKWTSAGQREWDKIVSNKTLDDWKPKSELPKGTKFVRTGDVLKLKRDDTHKARVVIKGFTMQPGVHFNQTYAPTVVIATFRILLALAAKNDWDIWQGDAPTAFMQPKIDTEIYVTPTDMMRHFSPQLRELERKHGRGQVAARVLKGLPGIPQGSRLWNQLMHKLLSSLKLVRSQVDFGLYHLPGYSIYLLIWVDDIFLFAAKDNAIKVDEIWKILQDKIGIEDKQPIEDCLGVDVKRDRPNRRIFLSQEKSIRKLQTKLGLGELKGAAATPMDDKVKLSKEDCPTPEEARTMSEEQSSYRSMVASLIYFTMWCRPDIAYAVSKLAKFMHNPGEAHQQALKRTLRYLFSSASLGLLYDFSTAPAKDGVYGYYDSSFADCPDTKRSTGGFILYWWGCAVNWSSKTNRYVTTSTNHSEYVAGAVCARECAFHESLSKELKQHITPIHLFSDSKGGIAQTYNPTNRAATKHIDVADHYIREQVERKRLTVTHVDTGDMDADIFTKALNRTPFLRHRSKMLCECPW